MMTKPDPLGIVSPTQRFSFFGFGFRLYRAKPTGGWEFVCDVEAE